MELTKSLGRYSLIFPLPCGVARIGVHILMAWKPPLGERHSRSSRPRASTPQGRERRVSLGLTRFNISETGEMASIATTDDML